jgi:hypothetical protein
MRYTFAAMILAVILAPIENDQEAKIRDLELRVKKQEHMLREFAKEYNALLYCSGAFIGNCVEKELREKPQ